MDIEDLPAEQGIIVTQESIRLWCIKFVALYTRGLKRTYRGYGDTFYIDEGFTGVPHHSDQRFLCAHAAVSNLFNPGTR